MGTTTQIVAATPSWLSRTVAEALGQENRADPVAPRTGGPAGNARLTAWTGVVLLVLFAAEGLTLVDTRGLITWHVVIGTLLLPPALLKTATTGWRVVRYYTRDTGYVAAGPPPAPLRVLGPLVVLSTLALILSGILLILLGQDRSHTPLVTVLGQRLDWVWVHQACFAVWFVCMTLHVLARFVPAMRLTFAGPEGRRRLPGGPLRWVALGVTAGTAVVLAVALVGAVGPSWSRDRHEPFPGDQHAFTRGAGTVRGS